MSPQNKVLSLTALILVLAGAIAGIMYFRGRMQSDDRRSKVDEVADGLSDHRTEPSDLRTSGPSSTDEIWSSVAVDQEFANPFTFKMQTPFKAATWNLQDAKGNVVASGFVSATGTVEVVAWYDEVPKSKTGWFNIADALSSAMPPYRIPVRLKTQTETVEAYFLNANKSAGRDCDQVFPVKRQVVSTGGNLLDHYQAALVQLLKGPTVEERAKGYATALPQDVTVTRVGQDESGRYIGDFDGKLFAGAEDACRRTSIKAQIQETLKTVPLQGRTLDGRVYVQGQEVEF